MFGHSYARDEPTRSQVDLTSIAGVLTASVWASIGKACVLPSSQKRH